MKAIYYPDGDTLVLRVSDCTPVRDVSQGWHVIVSYDAEGCVVEIVLLDASKIGVWPVVTDAEAEPPP